MLPELTEGEYDRINALLKDWQQGDIVLGADLGFMTGFLPLKPLTAEARKSGIDESGKPDWYQTTEAGFVVVSQTCDVVREAPDHPYVELAPLVPVERDEIAFAKGLRRSHIAYHPTAEPHGLVVDLQRTLTIEKSLLVSMTRSSRLEEPDDQIAFAVALANRRQRWAFRDDFRTAIKRFNDRISDKARKQSQEGVHVDAISEIRVHAEPNWDEPSVHLTFWLIKRGDPPGADWDKLTNFWRGLVDTSGKYRSVAMQSVSLGDMTAKDYTSSHRLDLDKLSVSKK